MASVLQVATIKDQGGNANAIEIANSSANVTINQLTASTKFPAGGTGNPISVAIIADEKSTDSNSGAATGDGVQYRDLNTEISDLDSIVTIDSVNKQFTIGAGTYIIEFSAPAYVTGRHHVLLWDQTAGAYVTKGTGTSEYIGTSVAAHTRSFGSCMVTPTSNNIYRIAHYTAAAKSTNGLGIEVEISGKVSIFTIDKIIKLK